MDDYNSRNDGKWSSFATWQSQTNKSIASYATALTVDGQIGSLSSVVQTVNNVTTRVVSLENGLSTTNGNLQSVTQRVSSLEVTDRSITQRVQSVETKSSSNESAIGSLSSEVNGIESGLDSVTSRVGLLETSNESIVQRVSAIESKPLDLCDVNAWEMGTTNETAGKTYDQIKSDSTSRIRTKGLYPVTDATTCVLSDTGRQLFRVFFVFFTAQKVVSSIKAGEGWSTQTGNGVKIPMNAPSDAAYVAVLLRKNGGSISVDDVRASGITITSDTIVTSAQISTFLTKDDMGNYVSWAQMKADNISFEFTKKWSVGVKNKGTVMELDTDGNLYVKGNVSGVITTNMAYSPVKYLDSPVSYTINLTEEPYHTYVNDLSGNTCTITLPDPDTFEGVELQFMSCARTARTLGDTQLFSSKYIHYGSTSDGTSESLTTVTLPRNVMFTAKALKGSWWIINGRINDV